MKLTERNNNFSINIFYITNINNIFYQKYILHQINYSANKFVDSETCL